MERNHSWREAAAFLLTAASGFAALTYQMVWTQQGALWLGHEAVAVLAVVAAFFGGLSLGALCFGRAVRNSAFPLRWYIVCEVVIALWGVLLAIGFQPVASAMLGFIGAEPSAIRHLSVAFGGTLLLLLPSTAAMGLTLPAMERLVSLRRTGSLFGGLYAANTLGAMAGVLATAFLLIPDHGLHASAIVAVLLNILCVAAALLLFRGSRSSVSTADMPRSVKLRRTLLKLAVTGFLGIGYEVVALRVLGQVTEQTVYTFACALAVYLAGTTLGAACWQRWWARRDADAIGRILLPALSLATLLGASTLWFSDALRVALIPLLGRGVWGVIGIEAVLALSAFALPTFMMGAVFSHLCMMANREGAGFGQAIGWNGAGAALAPAVLGVIAVPAIGPKWSLLLLSAPYLALLPLRAWGRMWTLVPAAAFVVVALFAPRLAFVEVPDGGSILSYKEGASAAVSVVEDAQGTRRLRIDNRQQEGSSSSYWFDARQAWLPLLLHPAPKRALFLGMGTGVTAAAALEDPALNVEVVELLPEVIAASALFTREFETGASAGRARVIAADARRYVRSTDHRFDVIVSDNFHPARSGAGSLYTVEHFQAVKSRLAEGGVFCQWLPLHQLDLESLRSIVRSYVQVFPDAVAMLASNSLETPVIGLVGRADDTAFDGNSLSMRRQNASGVRDLSTLGFGDELSVPGSLVAGPKSLREFARTATPNTDNRPVVAYRAPRLAYFPDSSPRDRFFQLIHEWQIEPAEVLRSGPPDLAPRLAAYWQARNMYLEAGRRAQPVNDVRRMLAQVREPLLAVLQVSPDFTPAFDPLLQMAQALSAVDRPGARTLAAELHRIRPSSQQARELHESLLH